MIGFHEIRYAYSVSLLYKNGSDEKAMFIGGDDGKCFDCGGAKPIA